MSKELENAWAVQEIWQDKCYKLEEENKKLKESLDIATKCSSKEEDGIIRLSEENKKLKEELDKFSDAYKRYRDYEKEELAESCYDLARENDKLKEENKWFNKKIKQAGKYVAATMKENKKLKADYIKLSKIVETTGGYKASYVNELRDKIAKLEIYKKQYKHTTGDYIDEDLYDLDC